MSQDPAEPALASSSSLFTSQRNHIFVCTYRTRAVNKSTIMHINKFIRIKKYYIYKFIIHVKVIYYISNLNFYHVYIYKFIHEIFTIYMYSRFTSLTLTGFGSFFRRA